MKKVLSIAMALLLCVSIVGCGSNSENEKPKDEPTNETSDEDYDGKIKNEEVEKFKLEKMSIEETKALKVGDRVDKFPDLNYLEQNGMAAVMEYQCNVYIEKDNDELELTDTYMTYIPMSVGEIEISKSEKYDEIRDEIKYVHEDTYVGIVLCSIVDVYTSEDGKNYVYILAPDGIETRGNMIDQNNIDAVKQALGLTGK